MRHLSESMERSLIVKEFHSLKSMEQSTLRKAAKNGSKLRWGQKIEFIPSHCCTTVAQHDNIYVIKEGKLAAVWPITARGKYY